MGKNHFTVVRNAAYRGGDFKTRQRHNERENAEYQNGDVVLERARLNIHYLQRQNGDGTQKSYQEIFERMLADGTIVKRGLQDDAKVFDELVFDVNTEYFEEQGRRVFGDNPDGGYAFAVQFYEEAYRLAVAEVGGEDYIISAVMHADERNREASERLGRDAYHYHLHVVYVPVVDKEIRWSKRCKDHALVGTVKETIKQISHSKKWPRIKIAKGYVNSYSLLQDRYFEHMRAAGFDGFERGERGSTAEHLDTLDYKIQQDTKRLVALDGQVERTAAQIATAEAVLSKTERTIDKKSAQIEKLDERIAVKEKSKATIAEVNAMGHSIPMFPGVHFTNEEAERLKGLAKKGVGVDKRADEQKKQIAALEASTRDMNSRLNLLQQDLRAVARDRDVYKQNYDRLWGEVKPFIKAIRTEPQKLLTIIQDNGLQKSTNREESL